jgi:two-component system sensor histidine kinase BaeS
MGIRTQLGIAMVTLAVLSIAFAGLLIHRTASGRLEAFGRSDLQQTADRLAVLAGFAFEEGRGWPRHRVEELARAEAVEGHAIVLTDLDGTPAPGSPTLVPPDSRRAAVKAGGRHVGAVIVGHPRGGYLQVGPGGAGRQLEDELGGDLDMRLAESALVAAGLALLIGVVLAFRVAGPLQRVTAVARRIGHGDIENRAAGSGGGREIQELAATLDQLTNALRRQDELRRATVADTVHEMRNALVGVVGRLEALQDGVIVDEQAALQRMERDAHRLFRLIEDVLTLAEAQRPGLLVRKAPVELQPLVAEHVAAHDDRFRERGILLHTRLAPCCADGDPERLGQIVENLLTNALRYTDPGGEVTVRLAASGSEAVLQVVDTGIGIAPEYMGRIFDRFWRLPEARDRAAEGSGVGLAVVRDLVLAHDGRIEVESRPGKGSTFRVFLPVSLDGPDDLPALQSDGAGRGTVEEPVGEPFTVEAAGRSDRVGALD